MPQSSVSKYCYYLIALMILVNATGLFSPVLNSNDAYFYATISKTMLIKHNWIDLIYNQQDWLDKPHFPFWLTALSFKLFGVQVFAYVLPGFLFHLLGAYYTYRLAKHLYNHDTALVAALIYLSALHLLLSAMDIRAEAYLLGEIMPACYYWLVYERKTQLRALLLASFFSALAMMTKGLFVVVTIFSGLVCSWIYTRQYLRIIQAKWLMAYLLCLIFTLPELVCLYLQFDAHPEKIVFGHNHVSGLAWYFWGSQFGRFFNSGPIVNTHGNPFFFIHTFLWAFLPWSLLFIAAIYAASKEFKGQLVENKLKIIYLFGGFCLTFILFSATKFQLDHYTNIIMPFAAILTANYLLTRVNFSRLLKIQTALSLLMLALTTILISYLFNLSSAGTLAILPIVIIVVIAKKPAFSAELKILLYPSLAISCSFLFLMLVNAQIYPRYSIGYQLARQANLRIANLPIYSYQVNGAINSLNFHNKSAVIEVNALSEIPLLAATSSAAKAYYLLINKDKLPGLKLTGKITLIASYSGLAMEKFIPALFSPDNYKKNLQNVVLILVAQGPN